MEVGGGLREGGRGWVGWRALIPPVTIATGRCMFQLLLLGVRAYVQPRFESWMERWLGKKHMKRVNERHSAPAFTVCATLTELAQPLLDRSGTQSHALHRAALLVETRRTRTRNKQAFHIVCGTSARNNYCCTS